MARHFDPDARIRNFDWKRAYRAGEDLAIDQVRRGDPVDDRAIMWALLCEACDVARITYSAPPRSGLPQKSTMPESPAEVTDWQLISAYLKGELDEMPTTDATPPQPTAAQVTRSEIVLEVWHRAALSDRGDWARIRKAVYLKACGVPDRKVRAITGFTRERIKYSRRQAVSDMIDFVKRLTNSPF